MFKIRAMAGMTTLVAAAAFTVVAGGSAVRAAGGHAVHPGGEAQAQTATDAMVRVLFQTEMGDIEMEVDTKHAPITANNFLRYVDRGFYDGGQFFRTVTPENQPNDPVKIEVIEASINRAHMREDGPPIPLERTNKTGLSHLDGTLSMGRNGPDTATSFFSICIGDQPALNFGGRRNPDGQGFAAFGRVVRGMDVVRRIQASPAKGQRLTPGVKIIKASRVEQK